MVLLLLMHFVDLKCLCVFPMVELSVENSLTNECVHIQTVQKNHLVHLHVLTVT